MTLLHPRHLTCTFSPSSRSNFFEPHFGQIGHALRPFMKTVSWTDNYRIFLFVILVLVCFFDYFIRLQTQYLGLY